MTNEIFWFGDKARQAVVTTMSNNSSKNGEWKTKSVYYHLDHAVEHVKMWAKGDASEPHLDHAITRLVMAREMAHAMPPAADPSYSRKKLLEGYDRGSMMLASLGFSCVLSIIVGSVIGLAFALLSR